MRLNLMGEPVRREKTRFVTCFSGIIEGMTKPPTRNIEISGARTNNLKNVHCAIPHEALTVITGLSGSGKSSLAFDTLYAEGQRRYVESMSAYARQFLERIEKPDVDQILHILPAIALEQKNRIKNARSTVGTATEVYDYLRLLFSSVGRRLSAETGDVIVAPERDIEEALVQLPERTKLVVLAPLPDLFRDDPKWMDKLSAQGYFRVYHQGVVVELAEVLTDLPEAQPVQVVIDRLIVRKKDEYRLREAIQNAFKLGQGLMDVVDLTEGDVQRYQEEKREGIHANLFSFNHPLGACPTCEGFGRIIGLDMDKVIPNREKSLKEGAVHPFSTPANVELQEDLLTMAESEGIPVDVPYHELTDEEKVKVINGHDDYLGIRRFFDWLETKRYKVHVRVQLAKYRGYYTCPDCQGSRLRPEALKVVVGGKTILDCCSIPVSELLMFIRALELEDYEAKIAERILNDVIARLDYLVNAGLGYLTLDRQYRTLSGGEAQRINLSTALGCGLTDTLYVLDEPTVGLHARDTHRLIDIIRALRDKGNTMVVVEHDPEMIRGADHIIDMGPSGGEGGGQIVYEGDFLGLLKAPDSVTCQYLLKAESAVSSVKKKKKTERRVAATSRTIDIIGAVGHNLKNVSVSLPKKQLVCVTGVSGSGKSTLIKQTLYTGYQHAHGRGLDQDGCPYEALRGLEGFTEVVMVDQSPPARSLRSNPVTYMKAYDEIRKLFADSRKAMVLGLKPGDFSFNTPGGRCEKCEGLGFITIDMQFMADVTVTCPECRGQRFKHKVLSVELFGRNINDVLNMTVADAFQFFKTAPAIYKRLKPLQDIGLSYLRLGQSTSTLSGGESQRLKLASYLRMDQKKSGEYLFLFDEPTTGLHMSDIDTLVGVFRHLVDEGHSLIVIEHNMDFIAQVDHVVDMGPEGGDKGGTVCFQGAVDALAANKESWTGRFLKAHQTAEKQSGKRLIKKTKKQNPRRPEQVR